MKKKPKLIRPSVQNVKSPVIKGTSLKIFLRYANAKVEYMKEEKIMPFDEKRHC